MHTPTLDENIIAGLVAVQSECISAEEFAAALRNGTFAKSTGYIQMLVDQGRIAAVDSAAFTERIRSLLIQDDDVALASTATFSNSHEESTNSPFSAQATSMRFLPEKLHGRGGFGQVWLATDTELSRKVAFKEIRDDRNDSDSDRERLHQEAILTGRLEHPAIVPVYSFGWSSPQRPYYAMRFIEGTTLESAIHEFHKMPQRTEPPTRGVRFLRLLKSLLQVCHAVEFAHRHSVIHCDIKPANIVLGDFGEAYLVDWGLANWYISSDGVSDDSHSDERIDPMTSVKGTLAYMSPEQSRGVRPGPRSDIYSLGATLYELLTGRKLFDIPQEAADKEQRVSILIKAIQEGRFPKPSDIDQRVDRELERICLKALQLAPKHRFASAGELVENLEQYIVDLPLRQWRRAVEHFETMCAAYKDQWEFHISLARGLYNLGVAHTGLKNFADATDCLSRAYHILASVVSIDRYAWLRRDLSATCHALARAEAEQGHRDAALAYYGQAQDWLEKYLGKGDEAVDLTATLFEPSDVGFFRHILGESSNHQ